MFGVGSLFSFLSLLSATLIGPLFKKFKQEFLALEEDGAVLRSFKDDKKKNTNLNYFLKVQPPFYSLYTLSVSVSVSLPLSLPQSCTSVVERSAEHNNAGWPADIVAERCFVLNNHKNQLVYLVAETPELAK